jgi:cell division protease FtsH
VALGASLVLWVVLPAPHAGGVPVHSLTYSQFLGDVSAHKVKTVTITTTTTGQATGTLTTGHDYTTVIPVQLAGSGLLDRLHAAKGSGHGIVPRGSRSARRYCGG